MKRFYQSALKSLRAAEVAPRGTRTRASIAEGLESRRLMAADLSGGMLGKFSPTAATGPNVVTVAGGPTSGYNSGIVTAAGDGANGASSSGDSDDKLSNAKKKSLNFSSDSNISSGLDVDMFKFTAKKGQRVTFDLDRPALSTLDSVLRIFNSGGQELTFSDDDASPTEADSLESYVDYTFLTSGTFYVGVSGVENVGYNAVTGAGDVSSPSTGAYKLIVEKYVNPDGNDTLATAGDSIGKNDDESGRISNPRDIDVYKIKVDAGDTIAFDIDSNLEYPTEPLDSYLRLFDDNGVQLAANDDGDDPTEVAATLGHSYFQYTFLEGGTYYIAVSGKGNQTYNPITGANQTNGTVGRYVLYTTEL